MSDEVQVEAPPWQAWLLPERPGMTQFMFGALCLVLPVAAIGIGTQWILPAMGVAATLGGGVGIGWALACAPRWLRIAPVTGLCVLAMALGCLLHLYLMPRLEVWLRWAATVDEVRVYLRTIKGGDIASLPSYDAGLSRPRLHQVEHPPAHGVVLYTKEAFQRWTLSGYRDSCYLVFYDDGRSDWVKVLQDADMLHAALREGR